MCNMISDLTLSLCFGRKLARIQTDSVAEKLTDLYPDVHFEIGKSSSLKFETLTRCLFSSELMELA